jgi:release factor glutamine methyltransferase
VSNPPYVDPADRDTLAPEVRDHEPATALFVADPGEYPARLASAARVALRPGGSLVVEIGIGLEDTVAGAFIAAGLRPVAEKRDLRGVVRAVVAERGIA